MNHHRSFLIAAVLLLLCGAGKECIAQPPDSEPAFIVRLSTGLYDVRRINATPLRQVEIGLPAGEGIVRPYGGFMATGTNDTFTYVGFLRELPLTQFLRVVVRFGGGMYSHGGGIDLGFPFEFRSELEIGWQWNDNHRVGVGFSHLSHTPFAGYNPGLETLAFSFSFTR